jgi:hypothetical protein
VKKPGRSALPPEEIKWSLNTFRGYKRVYWVIQDLVRQLYWAHDAAALARQILDEARVDAIITCGPPHVMSHEAGRRVAATSRVPLVLDLRDPWSLVRRFQESLASPMWFKLAKWYETRAVRTAALVVTNTTQVERAMRDLYPGKGDAIITVTNGFDGDPTPASRKAHFSLVYAGAIYLDRDPRPLFKGLKAAVEALGVTPQDLQLILVGDVSNYDGVATTELAAAFGLSEYVDVRGKLSREDLDPLLSKATVLISLPQDSPWAIPSKVYEYMKYSAALLIMAAPGSPTYDMLQGSRVDLVEPDDTAAIAAVITQRYADFEAGIPNEPVALESKFSRQSQARLLFAEIERLL